MIRILCLSCIFICFSANLYASDFQTLVDSQRKMLVLLDGSPDDDPNATPIFAARNYYVEKLETTEKILTKAELSLSSAPANELLPISKKLLDFVAETKSLHAADQLALLDLVDDLIDVEQDRGGSFDTLQPLKLLSGQIQTILDSYSDEYRKTMGKLGMRGGSKREGWDNYMNFLKSLYDYESLLSKTITEPPTLNRNSMRGSSKASKQKDHLNPAGPLVLWGNNLPHKTVVLTFDDGPHRSKTEKILNILKEYKVQAYFFVLGNKLGTINKKGEIGPIKRSLLVKRVLDEGHVLANHTFTHPVLTKLEKSQRISELNRTNLLLKKISKEKVALFRPPYGATDKDLEELTQKEGLATVMWNIDSMDWADPIPAGIADRVFRELDKQQKGILLFHDIHGQTIKALPEILRGLGKRGYKVVTLDGKPFSKENSGVPQFVEPKNEPLYNNSWAVVIGINNYDNWPKLKYAVNDGRSVAEALRTKLGFPKENVIELYDQDATRENISEVLGYTLANPKKVKPDDRVFVFYAGHGMTRELPGRGNLGYIIPVDAELTKFQNKGLSMSLFNDFSSLIPAKHLYFVMDSCYSGLALTRSGVTVGQTLNYLTQVTGRRGRQILTAGGADQQVVDGGPNGHSIFTWTFLQGLEGLADTDNNGYVTASELGTYVAPVVASYSEQTPAFGNLVGSQGGDFVFELDSNAVDTINKKLAEESARIEKELDDLKNNTNAMVKRRLELQLALEKAKKDVYPTTETVKADKKVDGKPSIDRVKQARRLNASALQFLKENRYKEAVEELKEAARLNPYNPTIVNNYGYALSKMGKNIEALKWYYRTVELDAKRTAVYLNLGDIMVEMGRSSEAIPYYERYLHLYPSYKNAKELREIINELKAE